MSLLVDTNVLLRAAQANSPDHAVAKATLATLRRRGTELCVVPQVIYEFWVAATRPQTANGLGMTTEVAERSIQVMLEDLSLRLDERGIFGRWQALVTQHEVKGKNAHDARLVAAMQRHGLTRILTFNGADFARFGGLEVMSPQEVLAGRSGE